MLSCKQTTRLLSAAQDRPLGFGERLSLKLHLLMCKGCTNYHQQMDFIRQACTRHDSHDKEERQ
ncbi:MAG: zf-HC2 domain-containing protein [Pseudomonadota bacterium]